MNKINIRRLTYHIRHRILTSNNMVMIVALCIAAGWAFGSVNVMERNYRLQAQVDQKNKELTLARLEVQTLKYENKYYESDEYKELAVRQRLGLAKPGETAIILPANSKKASRLGMDQEKQKINVIPTNTEQWLNFLLGDDSLQD